MAGTFVAQNIKIGNLRIGDNWNLMENASGQLSFEHNDTTQMTLEADASAPQTTTLLKLGEPSQIYISPDTSSNVSAKINFDVSKFKEKASSYMLKLLDSNVRFQLYNKDKVASESSNQLQISEELMNSDDIAVKFTYDSRPDYIICAVYPVQEASEVMGGSAVESFACGIKFIQPAPKSKIMNAIASTSGAAGGTVTDKVPEMTAFALDGASWGSETGYRAPSAVSQVGQSNSFSYSGTIKDDNGRRDMKKVTVRFFQVTETDFNTYNIDDYTTLSASAMQIQTHKIYKTTVGYLPNSELPASGSSAIVSGDFTFIQNSANNSIDFTVTVNLDKSLHSTDVKYLVPYVFVNDSSTAVSLNGVSNYDIVHVTEKPLITVRDGSYKVMDSAYSSVNDSSWVWETSDLIAGSNVTSHLLSINNESASVAGQVSIAFNNDKFLGKVYDSSTSPPEVPFSNGVVYSVSETNYDSSLNALTVPTITTSSTPLTSSNIIVNVPANKTIFVKYTLTLPAYLPATTYNQTFTVTDVTEYGPTATI